MLDDYDSGDGGNQYAVGPFGKRGHAEQMVTNVKCSAALEPSTEDWSCCDGAYG